MYIPYGKRFIDLCVAIAGLIILSPFLLVIAALIRALDGKPVLFRQERPGLNGRPFILLKFRTMRQATDANGKPRPDAVRLTRMGAFLRDTSLDELPELINIIRGEMSLVGPRPLLMEYLPRYTPQQALRHEVRPGLTGWAQANGRNALTWEEKFTHDVWYVDNRSFLLDLRILLRTVGIVSMRQGVNQPGHATAEPFHSTETQTLTR